MTRDPRASASGSAPAISSFYGLSSGRSYRSRYGAPIRQERRSYGGNNYVVHHYGGWGSGFMTGYLAGSAPWYWSMPFHPAFYYSRPYYVHSGGGYEVYPGTFSLWRLLWGLFVLAAVTAFVIWLLAKLFGGSGRRVRSFRSSFE